MTLVSEPSTTFGSLHVSVLTDRCAGCQECIVRCPPGALTMDPQRWIAVADDALCVGCRQCERTCPFSAITVDGPLAVSARTDPNQVHPKVLVGDSSEVRPGFRSWDEALVEAARCLDCPDPTCVRGCPAHNDIPSFINAIREGDLVRAHDVLRRTSVLPDTCSRVCDQATQCEGACTWSLAGGTPVAIGRLERFVADTAALPSPLTSGVEGRGLTVAIVGSGPAGIGAAWHLVEAGAAVTVYEKEPEPGGLLDWGIPDFTLPAAVAERPWQQLIAAGVDLRCGVTVAAEDMRSLLTDHHAVILAHGAGLALRLPVPGADLDGVVDATSFLKAGKQALRNADPHAFADHRVVLVLGAGNTAMDVARTACRLGLHTVCVDWVDERFALARPDELQEARDDGVDVRFSRTVVRLDGDDRVKCAVLARTKQDRADRRPKVLARSEETLDVDLVVMAMGYRADPAFPAHTPGTPVAREPKGLPDRRWVASGLLANPAPAYAHHKPIGRLARGREIGLAAAELPVDVRVWVAGDALVGPSTVVEAMAQGRRAAAGVLAAQLARARTDEPRQVLVAYDNSRARGTHIGRRVAAHLRDTGAVVRAVPFEQICATDLASTDLLVIGLRATRRSSAWLSTLPRLPAMRVAIFRSTVSTRQRKLAAIRGAVEDRGAIVLIEYTFGRRDITADVQRFGDQLRAAAEPTSSRT